MVEVMSDKMQMQRCRVVVTVRVEKIDSEREKGLAKHWRAARLASSKIWRVQNEAQRPPLGLELGRFLTLEWTV
jgi:hypothetical protein